MNAKAISDLDGIEPHQEQCVGGRLAARALIIASERDEGRTQIGLPMTISTIKAQSRTISAPVNGCEKYGKASIMPTPREQHCCSASRRLGYVPIYRLPASGSAG